jgi:mannosyltransferase OCH1-like enzyme
MDNFIKLNFDNTIFSAYSKINIGAGKSDFWRYCVLYVNGGVYLDIDSIIDDNLDSLIGETDQCVISREGGFGNQGKFLQWCLIFQRGHPILKELIDICVDNINKKVSTNLVTLTGPIPYTRAINRVMGRLYSKKVDNLYYESDKNLNRELNNPENEVRAKFHKHDYRPFMNFEMNKDVQQILRKGTVHWRDDKTPVISD